MGGQEQVVSPTACHAHPRWQAASQSSHPFPHCLTVLALHLAQQPGFTEGAFSKSGRVIHWRLTRLKQICMSMDVGTLRHDDYNKQLGELSILR